MKFGSSATYLDYEVLEGLLVLRVVSIKLVLKAVYREYFQIFDTRIPLLHLLQTRLIVASRNHLAMIDLLVRHQFLEALVELVKLILVDTLALVLAIPLTQHLDLKGFLMGVLSHHALQLEGISIELHCSFFLRFLNIILLKISI